MKKVIICLFAGLIGCMSVLFGGCLTIISKRASDPWDSKMEENGFYYYLEDKGGLVCVFPNKPYGAVILGITTDLYLDSYEKGELIIPEKLGGYTVTNIGTVYQPFMGDDSTFKYYTLSVAGIKRLIVNHEVTIGSYGLSFTGELILNAKANLGYGLMESCKLIQINTNDNQFDMAYYDYDKMSISKITFDSMGGQQKTYAEIIRKNGFLPEPEEPTKDGYTFAGWYTDENYQKEWNFEEDLVAENMTLYAKWIEN